MSITSTVIKETPTGHSWTAGDDATLIVLGGSTEKLKAQISVTGESLAQHDRETIDFYAVRPKVDRGAPNGYTQARSGFTLKAPKTLANEERTNNSIRIEMSCDVETTDVEKTRLRYYAAQVLAESEFDAFWNAGSVV